MTATGDSYRFYNGDGVATTYAIGFDYLDEAHVKVYEVESSADVLKTAGTHYNIVGSDVVFTAGNIPDSGTDNVKIIRVTPVDWASRSVDFGPGTLSEGDLELNQKHIFYIVQEAAERDDGGTISPGAEYIRFDSSRNVWDAARTGTDTGLGNLADPTADDEAATKKYVDDVAEFGVAGVPQYWNWDPAAAAASHTLAGGVNLDTAMVIVAIDGVIQAPAVDYNIVKGDPDSTLVLTSALAGTEKLMVINMGKQRFLNSAVLGDGSIVTAKLADDCVTAAKIADDAVGTAQIADDAVESALIADAAVIEAAIADSAVAYAKLKATGFVAAPLGGTDHALVVDEGTGNLSHRVLTSLDISDWVSKLAATKLSGLSAPDASVSMGNQRITALGAPSAGDDAATKTYVDGAVAAGESKVELIVDEVAAGTPGSTWEPAGMASKLSSSYYAYTIVLIPVSTSRLGGIGLYQSAVWNTASFTPWASASITESRIWNVSNGNTVGSEQHGYVSFGSWAATAATNLRIVAASGNFAVGDRVLIYGHKGLV